MTTTKERRSGISPRLQRLVNSSLPTAPLNTQAPYSYTLPGPPSASTVELCPPHWRLPHKKALRSKLKNLVLKTPALEVRANFCSSQQRPPIMRMKDSDDYITARAANPRTGLISPSVGSPSPRTPCTPDTPREALRLPKERPDSPTPESRARPVLSRANEGRKVSAGSLNRWRADAKGWVSKTVLAAASPRETATTVGAGWSSSTSQPIVNDDRFVMHMPSAREPQPYIYPGRTAEEIEAFEHYKHKARRVSDEGWGERRLSGNGMAFGRERKTSAGSAFGHGRTDLANASVKPYKPISLHAPQSGIVVAKRPKRSYAVGQDQPSVGGAELSAATFAPFSSPRTPAPRPAAEDTVLNTVRMPGAYQDITPAHLSKVAFVHRKPVSTSPKPVNAAAAPQYERHIYNTGSSPESAGTLHPIDLRQLPRVRLVHPEFASLPLSHALRRNGDGSRKCSLGCQQQQSTGQCLASKNAAGHTTPSSTRPSLFYDGAQAGYLRTATKGSDIVGIFLSLATYAIDAGKHLHLPRVGMLEALRTPNATPQQKVDALKALLALTGQGLALLMVVTVLWRLGAAVMHVLEVLLWPLAVPFKIMRWLAGYA